MTLESPPHDIGRAGIFRAGDSQSSRLPIRKTLPEECGECLAGQPQTHTFCTALMCIIDSLDSGGLVFRNERRNFQFRASPLHWGKSRLEKRYLKPHRGVA